ncbi:MAG: 23S rRNA (uracil(1939)-C(5))-methyltransferase RlmD [Patescibacteria group bacterium]|nr:23S rRNA (uracil(1939)-C(5))-methyltransferase RlmD [Patescibacteria group bacterium]
MTLKKNQHLEVTIESVAYKGVGIARHEGQVIFVPRTIPGQVLRVQVSKIKKNYAEAKILEVLKKADNEIDPICPHFEECGGCTWQHVSYQDQLGFKQNIILDSLRGIQRTTETPLPVQDIIASPLQTHYRNKVEFGFGEDGKIGFNYRGSFWNVIPMTTCHIATKEMNTIREITKTIWNEQFSDIPKYHKNRHSGLLRFLQIRHAYNNDDILVNLVHSSQTDTDIILGPKGETHTVQVTKEHFDNFIAALTEAYKQHNPNINFCTTRNDNLSDAPANATGLETVVHLGKDHIFETLGDKTYKISVFSFFQTNSIGAEVLYDTVKKYALDILKTKEKSSDLRVLDLFCGTGTIGQYLSDIAGSIVGIDIEKSSIKDAYINADINNITNVEYIDQAAEKAVQDIQDPHFDLAIVDPPRAGIHPKALKWIREELQTDTMIYVSCNPTTLSRDLENLGENWEIKSITPVDMFPQTYHVETVVLLEKKK